MASWSSLIQARSRIRLVTLAIILVLFPLALFLPPDGNEGAAWAQFIGRFHPLAVHLPIALILLVPVLELAGLDERLSHLRSSASFVLGLATIAAAVAAILGWILGRNGGYSGPLITQHMWGGLFLAIVCWVCWTLRSRDQRPDVPYWAGLVIALGLVSWTGYRGGQIAHGENHLLEYMPGALRSILGIPAETAPAPLDVAANTFYYVKIRPVFASHCVTCHGPEKQRSRLRLDSYASVMHGGKHGAVIKPRDAKGSELLRRVTLPPSDDDFMPKEGKRPLSQDEVKLLELWIAGGASATAAVDSIQGAPAGSPAATAETAEVTFPEIDPAAVAQQRAPIQAAVTELQKRFPTALSYESRGSADLIFNASLLGPKFTDKDLEALAPVAGHIVEADFSRSGITDHAATPIAAMRRLRVLRLNNTKIGDATIQALAPLDQLESLSVFETAVTPAILPVVARLPKLRRFYAGETAISRAAAIPPNLKETIVF